MWALVALRSSASKNQLRSALSRGGENPGPRQLLGAAPSSGKSIAFRRADHLYPCMICTSCLISSRAFNLPTVIIDPSLLANLFCAARLNSIHRTHARLGSALRRRFGVSERVVVAYRASTAKIVWPCKNLYSSQYLYIHDTTLFPFSWQCLRYLFQTTRFPSNYMTK